MAQLVPHTPPLVADARADNALQPRWRRARTMLVLSMAVLPVGLVVVCLVLAGLSAAAGAVPLFALVPLLAAGSCAAVLVIWLRRHGLMEPRSWFPATVLMTGAQLVLGVFPGFGVAVHSIAGAARAGAGVLVVVGLVCAGLASRTAQQAKHTVLQPVIEELGATGFHLTLDDEPASARVDVWLDGVDWTVDVEPRIDAGLSFADVREVAVAPGDGVVVSTRSGSWTVPASDPELLHGVLVRRMELWRATNEPEEVVAGDDDHPLFLAG